ncbi:flagellar brake protein [Bacillus massilinigeriensis]|uniref:flagellar brake protein n=1 Tax=Bacillus mediterraneensis TaxID=1805474 RepID=UPI0008F96C3B|nr:flagellar brake domain-containing protein [Bacillus mediterraneensis]
MLKIGDAIILEHFYGNACESYKCKIVEMRENSLFIDYPLNINTGKNVYLLEGTPLKAMFTGEGGGRYQFPTEVKGRIKEGIPMLILSKPNPATVIKVQRRQYVRVEASIDIAVLSLETGRTMFTAVTEDFSAGGAALLAAEGKKLKPGIEVICLLVLPMQDGEFKYRHIRSKIIRTQEKDTGYFRISVMFLDASPLDKQLFLRFCFERQLDLKKKGLLVHG